MAKRLLALFLTVLLVALAGCASAPGRVAQQLVQNVNQPNLDGAARLFASDALVDAGSSAYFSGRGEIEHWLGGLFADNLKLSLGPSEVRDDRVTAAYTMTLDSARGLGVTSLSGTTVMTVRGGRITELRLVLNPESQARLLKSRLTAGSPKLTYAVLPDPSPLRVSKGKATSEASLTLLITNGTGQPVRPTSIELRLPEGFKAGHLTGDPSKIRAPNQIEDWSVTKNGPRFTLSLKGDKVQLDAGQGLSLPISNILVNEQPGLCNLEITEETEDATGKSRTASTTIQLAKLPARFFVGDLKADELIVKAGETTTLTWSGSEQARYTIKYVDDAGHEVDRLVEDGPPYQFSTPNLKKTTTFYLVAEAREGENAVTVQRERTITVR